MKLDRNVDHIETIRLISSPRYCVAHNGGFINALSWCPHRAMNTSELTEPETFKSELLPRLGLLAVAGAKGTVDIYR